MLAAPPPSPPQVVAPGAVIDWEAKRDGDRRVFRSGPYRLTFATAKRAPAITDPAGGDGGLLVQVGAGPAQGREDGRNGGGVLISGAVGFADNAYARVAVARLDPTSPIYSVLVTSFTGGAHCCDDVQIATPAAGASVNGEASQGWAVLRPGAFDGAQLGFGGQGARLPAGADGTFGLSIPDDRFDYVFDCFACSYAPLRIYGLHAGALVERTAEPPFRALLEADMRQAEVGCRAHNTGVCPGFLADAARLGLWAQAWRVVTASIPAQPRGGYPNQLCGGVRVENKCRPGERAQPIPTYAASVRLFLKWRGYPVPAAG